VANALIALRNIIGTVGLLFAAYLFLVAVPALRRYIRILTMFHNAESMTGPDQIAGCPLRGYRDAARWNGADLLQQYDQAHWGQLDCVEPPPSSETRNRVDLVPLARRCHRHRSASAHTPSEPVSSFQFPRLRRTPQLQRFFGSSISSR
jgi:hypothetical protein